MRSLFGGSPPPPPPPPAQEETVPGFYGKVPAVGDFLSRRMPHGFVPAWDEWLQRLMQASRDRLGEAWLDAWLQAPIWHFALGHGVAGAARAYGVLIPSVDRVGRYFPFSIVGLASPDGGDRADWSGRVEALALSALDDGFDAAALEAELLTLGAPGDRNPPGAPSPDSVGHWTDSDDLDAALAGLAAGETLWWSQAGTLLLRCAGLPADHRAAGLVTGRMEQAG